MVDVCAKFQLITMCRSTQIINGRPYHMVYGNGKHGSLFAITKSFAGSIMQPIRKILTNFQPDCIGRNPFTIGVSPIGTITNGNCLKPLQKLKFDHTHAK